MSAAPGPRSGIDALASRRPLQLVGLGVLLYSTAPVLVQASDVSGPVFSFWRLWIGVPVLGALTVVHARAGGRMPDRRALRWALWAGLAFGLHQVLFMTAVKATSVSDVALMGTLAPVLVAVAAVPLFGERPGPAFRAWTMVAVAGAAVVVTGGSIGPEGSAAGMAMAAGNVAAFTGFFLLSKLSRADLAVLPFLLGVIVIAALGVSLFVAATEDTVAIGGADLVYAATLAVGPGALGHFLMTWPLRFLPINIPAVMKLSQPVLAGLLAWLLLAEAVTAAHLFGGALTLVGVGGAMLSQGARRLTRGPAPNDLPA